MGRFLAGGAGGEVPFLLLARQEDAGVHALQGEGQLTAGCGRRQDVRRDQAADAQAGGPAAGGGGVEGGEASPDGGPGGAVPEEVVGVLQRGRGAVGTGAGGREAGTEASILRLDGAGENGADGAAEEGSPKLEVQAWLVAARSSGWSAPCMSVRRAVAGCRRQRRRASRTM